MTTFLYTTTSNAAAVNDITAVQAVFDRYEFQVSPSLDEDLETVSFSGVDTGNFDVSDPTSDVMWNTRQFLEELAPYLDEELVIKCVETQGHGGVTAYKWIVEPDGDVIFEDF